MEIIVVLGVIGIIVGAFSVVTSVILGKAGVFSKKTIDEEQLDKIGNFHKLELESIKNHAKIEVANKGKELQIMTTKHQRVHEKLLKLESKNQTEIDEEENSVESLMENYDVDPIKAQEYMKKFNLNPSVLTNPALSKMLWEKLHENQMVAMSLGVLIPKGTTPGTVSSVTDILKGGGGVTASSDVDAIDALVDQMESTA